MQFYKSIPTAIAIFLLQPAIPMLSQEAKVSFSIMCIGDSITEGGNSFIVYRPLLYEKLNREFEIEFTGTKGTDLKHEGYGGKNIEFLAKTVPDNFAKHPADAILIHAGHNNFAKNKPVPKILENTRNLIKGCRTTKTGCYCFSWPGDHQQKTAEIQLHSRSEYRTRCAR